MVNIKLDSNLNIRDLGGLSCGNYIVKNKQFIRSGNISELTDNDISVLKNNYNLRTIIDLRNNYEIREHPDVKIKGVKYYHIPILSERVDGITREGNKVKMNTIPNISDLYLQMVSNFSSASQIKKVMKVVMKEKNKCILFHCSVGKDRTGIIAMLILAMLGASVDTIMKDYLYSNKVCEIEATKNYKFLFDKTHDEEYALKYKDVLLAKDEYLMAAIDYMITEYGSILDYIRYELGIKDKYIEAFRKNNLIEEEIL